MTNNVEEFIEHVGVKGMRWGVRRAQKKTERSDNKFVKKANRQLVSVHNAAADKTNSIDVPRINNKPEYKNLNVSQMGTNHPLVKKYYKEHASAMEKRLNDASAEIIGTSKSGRFSVKFNVDPKNLNQSYMLVDHNEVKHASDEQFIIKLEFDDKGLITKYIVEDDTLQQDVDMINNILEHVGVKGMRWGVRRSSGPKRSPSSDAQRVAALRNRKPSQLSNKQLKTINERMNLERSFQKLNPSAVKRGAEAAGGILATVGVAFTAYNMINSPGGKALVSAGKKFAGKFKR